jgi:hypothetical protein
LNALPALLDESPDDRFARVSASRDAAVTALMEAHRALDALTVPRSVAGRSLSLSQRIELLGACSPDPKQARELMAAAWRAMP